MELSVAIEPPSFFRSVESEYREASISGWKAFEDDGKRWLTRKPGGIYESEEGPAAKIYSVRTTTGDDGTVVETWPTPDAEEPVISGDEAAGDNAETSYSAPWDTGDFSGIMPGTWLPWSGFDSLEQELSIGNYIGGDGSGGLIARQWRWRIRWRSDVATNGTLKLRIIRHLYDEFPDDPMLATGVHVPFFYSDMPTGFEIDFLSEFADTGYSLTAGPLGEVASFSIAGEDTPPLIINLGDNPDYSSMFPYRAKVFPLFDGSSVDLLELSVPADWSVTGDYSTGEWEELDFDPDYKLAPVIFYFDHPPR